MGMSISNSLEHKEEQIEERFVQEMPLSETHVVLARLEKFF
jgi:hypothetical protein